MRRRVLFSVCVLLAACAATVNTASPVRVHLAFDPQTTVPASVLKGVLREVEQIWAPYGIAIDTDQDQANAGTVVDMALVVLFDTIRNAEGGDTGLGTIQFATDGVPASTVTVYYRALMQMVMDAGTAGSENLAQWPVALRDQVVARALGRALAHELGHFVLRSPHHAGSGLMQPRHHVSALTESSRKAFALTGVDRARLRVVLAAQSRALNAANVAR